MTGEKKFFLKRRKSGDETNATTDIEEANVITKSARTDSSTDEIALPRTIRSSFFLRQQQQLVTSSTETSINDETSINVNEGTQCLRHQHLFVGNISARNIEDDDENKSYEEYNENDKSVEISVDKDSLKEKSITNSQQNNEEGKQSKDITSHSQQSQQQDVNLNDVMEDFKDFDLNKYRDAVLARFNDFSMKFKARKRQLETQYKLVQDLNSRLVEVCRNSITKDPMESILSKIVARRDQLNRVRNVINKHAT